MSTIEIRNISQHVLQAGLDSTGMMVGIVSRIYDGKYEVYAVSSQSGIPHIGDVYALNAVYCREVLEKNKTVAITEVNNHRGMCLHPLYTLIPCEAYLGSPIIVNNSIWGTLNYTSFEMRPTSFTKEEIEFNELQAAKIAKAIMA